MSWSAFATSSRVIPADTDRVIPSRQPSKPLSGYWGSMSMKPNWKPGPAQLMQTAPDNPM